MSARPLPAAPSLAVRFLAVRFLAVRCLAVLCLTAGLVRPPPAVPAEDTPAEQVHVRGQRTIPDTVAYLEAEARRLGVAQVIVAFDAPTFDPPPGLTEFTLEYPFFGDLPEWLGALEAWGRRATYSLRATSSLAPRTLDLKEPGAAARLDDLIHSAWWTGERPAALPDAPTWMTSVLARTEDAARALDATPARMLVLISGGVTPEAWLEADADKGFESEWRRKLSPIGTYFDEGQVRAALAPFGCRLYVVAPEARFGDFTPYVELPELPWVARPHLPGDTLRTTLEHAGPRRGGRQRLEERLRDGHLDPEERRRLLEEALKNPPPERTGPDGPGFGPPSLRLPREGGVRFASATPTWFHAIGGAVPYNNHAPSGYGHWALANAAARTGGRYVFYPFAPARWLDACPANLALLRDLAPELGSRAAYLAARRGDPVLGVLARACTPLLDETPWADAAGGGRWARSWMSFLRTSPLRLEDHVSLRRKPFDDALHGSEDGIERLGLHVRDDVLPLYDRAADLLDEAAARYGPGRDGVHPRSHAHLLLTRFGVRMSAFHLAAYALYATEIERFIPDSMKGHVDHILVTYVPTIRMSDCLAAYDGRTLSPREEGRYPRWLPPDAPGYQGNLLQIPEEEPDYRAQRSLPLVLRHLDPRLRRRALQMIEAARDVMATYGETGWGWTTYYADAVTFVFHPREVPRGHQPSRGGGKPAPRPTTPRGGSTGGGGSSGTGPTSGGG